MKNMLSVVSSLVGLVIASSGTTAQAAMAKEDPNPGFSLLWTERLEEIPDAVKLPVVSGEVPKWLDGHLIRNGPSQLTSPGRNVTWIFDGLAKLYSWQFDNGQVYFREKFAKSPTYNKTQEDKKFPKMMAVGPVTPPYGLKDSILPMGDNVNVVVWQMLGDDKGYVMTDSVSTDVFDVKTLDFITFYGPVFEKTTSDWPDELAAAILSCAHPHVLPGSGGKNLVNVAIGLAADHVTIHPFKMGPDSKRKPFGVFHAPKLSYIHSFAVTDDFLVVMLYPATFELPCLASGKALANCLSWTGDKNPTGVVVFDLHSTDAKKAPIFESSVDSFISMHQINAYQEAGVITADYVAFPNADFWLGDNPFGEIDVMQDRDRRNKIDLAQEYRRAIIDPKAQTVAMESHKLVDSDGNGYQVEFPFINFGKGDGGYDAKKYCYWYSFCSNAQGSAEFADWGTVKVNVCAKEGEANTLSWFKKHYYPVEAIFAPRPGATEEDDGVVLISVLHSEDGDKEKAESFLVILDGQTFEEIAWLKQPGYLPFMFHGKYLPAP